jgi:hypothetical protein
VNVSNRKPNPKEEPMGAPPPERTAERAAELAGLGCPPEEIAAVLGCRVAALERRFPRALARGRLWGAVELRRAQRKAALEGNATVLTWLAKALLGQSDKPDAAAKAGAPEPDAIICIPDNGRDRRPDDHPRGRSEDGG